MAAENIKAEQTVGEMHKRREMMADGRRYIIYYTFGEESATKAAENQTAETSSTSEAKENE